MLTQEEIDDVQRRRGLGEPAHSIASDYDITVGYIYKIGKGKVQPALASRTEADSETKERQRLLAWPAVGRHQESEVMKIENGQAHCSSVNLRKEKHGDEKVAAITLKLTGLRASADLFDEFCPIEGLSLKDVFFVDQNPRLQQLFPLKVDLELEPYNVKINNIQIPDCTIKGIGITPEVGGGISVDLQINAQLIDRIAAPLAHVYDEDVKVRIEAAQVDLDQKAA